MPRQSLNLIALALLGACSSSPEDVDAGASADAAATIDSAAAVDAPAIADAGPFDGNGGCIPGDGSCTGDEVCRPALGTNNLVCQSPGAIALGQVCGAGDVDDCVAEGVCYDMWNTGTTSCRRFCTYEAATIPCPGNNKVCINAFGDQPAGVCLGNNCTPPADGCNEGQKCAIANNEVWACMPAGEVAVGDDCSVDWCVAGAQCGSGSICKTLCDATDDCADGTHCVWVGIDNIPEWGVCEDGCDVVSQVGCSPGADSACTMMDSEDGATDCFAPGEVAVGGDCSGASLCVPGAECLNIDSSWSCAAFCDDAHPCASGTCQSYGVWFPALRLCQ